MKKTRRLIVLLGIVLGLCLIPSISRAEEVEVSTFADAKAAISAGNDIKLMGDITATGNLSITKPVSIDLNGNTIDMGGYVFIAASNNTVLDSSDGKEGKITGRAQFAAQVGASTSTGTIITGNLTLESGTIECTGKYGVSITEGSSLIINEGTISGKDFVVYNQGTFKMNGGKVYAQTGRCVQNYINSTFEMNDGIIETIADYQAINLYGDCSATINGGQIIAMKDGTQYTGNGITAFKNTELTINGGIIKSYGNAILGNGSGPESGSSNGTNAKFNINGGTIISEIGAGIYAPQINGVTTITGGTITGKTGIEVRAGKLIISGGTIEGNSDEYVVTANANGVTTKGAAVSVAQHTSKQPIDVQITGGTFNANVAFSEANALGNSPEDVAKISLSISGGDFNSTGDDTVKVTDYSEGFITGGKYTNLVTEYVKDGYGEKPESGKVAVYKYVEIVANQSPNGTITLVRKKLWFDNGEIITIEEASEEKVRALYGDEIEVVAVPTDGYIALNGNEIISGQGTIRIIDNVFHGGTQDESVRVQFAKPIVNIIDTSKPVEQVEIGVTDSQDSNNILVNALKNSNELDQLSIDIDPTIELIIEEIEITGEEENAVIDTIGSNEALVIKSYNIYIAIKDESGNEIGRIHELPEAIEFAIVLPQEIAKVSNGYVRTYSVVREHDGYELIDSKVSSGNNSVSFKSDKFSTFSIAYVEEKSDNETKNESEDTNKKHPITGDTIIKHSTVLAIGVACLYFAMKRKTRRIRSKGKH